jgi:uncharacterized protein (TIGR02284 family)
MNKTDHKPVEMLNTLVGINTNRIECYNFICAKTDISVLRVLFSRLTETSMICREELINEVYKLGGIPQKGTLATSEFLKAWLEVYNALKQQDHKAILDSCCNEEGVVIKTYGEMLEAADEQFPSYQYQLLNRQYDALKADCEKVLNLRKVLIQA